MLFFRTANPGAVFASKSAAVLLAAALLVVIFCPCSRAAAAAAPSSGGLSAISVSVSGTISDSTSPGPSGAGSEQDCAGVDSNDGTATSESWSGTETVHLTGTASTPVGSTGNALQGSLTLSETTHETVTCGFPDGSTQTSTADATYNVTASNVTFDYCSPGFASCDMSYTLLQFQGIQPSDLTSSITRTDNGTVSHPQPNLDGNYPDQCCLVQVAPSGTGDPVYDFHYESWVVEPWVFSAGSDATEYGDLEQLTPSITISTGKHPIAKCDAYWVQPQHTLSVGAPGVLRNDLSNGNGTLVPVVDHISFGVSSHPYSLRSSGAVRFKATKPGTATISYHDVAADGAVSPPSKVTVYVRATRPPAALAKCPGSAKATQKQKPGAGGPTHRKGKGKNGKGSNPTKQRQPSPGRIVEGDAAWVCGTSSFNWYDTNSDRFAARGPHSCVFVFSHKLSDLFIARAQATNNSVSTVIKDLLSSILKGYATNKVPPGHVGSGIEEAVIKPLVEPFLPQNYPKDIRDKVLDLLVKSAGEMADDSYALYGKLTSPVAQWFASQFSGFTNYAVVHGGGCFEFDEGELDGKAGGALLPLFSGSQIGGEDSSGDPTTGSIGHVINSKGQLFRVNLACDAAGYAQVRFRNNVANVFSNSGVGYQPVVVP